MDATEMSEWINSLKSTWRFWIMAFVTAGLAAYGYWMSTFTDGFLLGIMAVLITLFAYVMTRNHKEGADI